MSSIELVDVALSLDDGLFSEGPSYEFLNNLISTSRKVLGDLYVLSTMFEAVSLRPPLIPPLFRIMKTFEKSKIKLFCGVSGPEYISAYREGILPFWGSKSIYVYPEIVVKFGAESQIAQNTRSNLIALNPIYDPEAPNETSHYEEGRYLDFPDEECLAIMKDDISALQELAANPNFSPNSMHYIGPPRTSSPQIMQTHFASSFRTGFSSHILAVSNSPSLTVAALYGSIKCFKFLLLSGAEIHEIKSPNSSLSWGTTVKSSKLYALEKVHAYRTTRSPQLQSKDFGLLASAVFGGNLEILRILENAQDKPTFTTAAASDTNARGASSLQNYGFKSNNQLSTFDVVTPAIIFHRYDVLMWAIETLKQTRFLSPSRCVTSNNISALNYMIENHPRFFHPTNLNQSLGMSIGYLEQQRKNMEGKAYLNAAIFLDNVAMASLLIQQLDLKPIFPEKNMRFAENRFGQISLASILAQPNRGSRQGSQYCENYDTMACAISGNATDSVRFLLKNFSESFVSASRAKSLVHYITFATSETSWEIAEILLDFAAKSCSSFLETQKSLLAEAIVYSPSISLDFFRKVIEAFPPKTAVNTPLVPETDFDRFPIDRLLGRCNYFYVRYSMSRNKSKKKEPEGYSPLYLAICSPASSAEFVNLLLDSGADHDFGAINVLQLALASRHLNSPPIPAPDEYISEEEAALAQENLLNNGSEQSDQRISEKAEQISENQLNEEEDVNEIKNPGFPELVKKLCSEKRLDDGFALEYCCKYHMPEIVEILLDNGANPDKGKRHSPLWVACGKRKDDVVKMLLDRGANVNFFMKNDFPPLIIISEQRTFALREREDEKRRNILEMILEHPQLNLNQNVPGKDSSLLLKLISMGDEESALRIIQRGADLAGKPNKEALIKAISMRLANVVEALVENGIDINSRDYMNSTPLHYAAAGDERIVRFLIEKGADPNCLNDKKETPLFIAVEEKKIKCVKELLDRGADKTIPNEKKVTPLMKAKQLNFKAALKILEK